MNKEEIEEMYKVLTEQWGDTDNYVNDLIHYSKQLQQENKQLKELCDKYEEEHNTTFKEWSLGLQERIELQERIDKAIEYIEKNNFYRVITYQEKDKGIVELDKLEILDILKGDSNEIK